MEEPSRVSEVRRSAQTMAREQGMDETMCGRVAVIATELCTNLLKHASEGEVFLSELTGSAEPGIELIALDRGPGMADVSACVADGFSTSQTAGTGLGAVARLSQTLDIYSQPALGTVVVAQIGGSAGSAHFDVGGIVKPMHGEDVSGDAWAYREQDGKLTVIVADGLGHGIMAARASAEAVAAFRGRPRLISKGRARYRASCIAEHAGRGRCGSECGLRGRRHPICGSWQYRGCYQQRREAALHGFSFRYCGIRHSEDAGVLVSNARRGTGCDALGRPDNQLDTGYFPGHPRTQRVHHSGYALPAGEPQSR